MDSIIIIIIIITIIITIIIIYQDNIYWKINHCKNSQQSSSLVFQEFYRKTMEYNNKKISQKYIIYEQILFLLQLVTKTNMQK